MKPHLILVAFVYALIVNAQTNTFPNSGNVGIGTTSPSEKLHVWSPSGNNQVVKLYVTGTGENNAGTVSNNRVGGYFASGTADDASFGRYNVGVESWYGIGFKSTFNNKAGIVFNTRSASGFFEGKLGVGTDNPSAIFEVNKNFDGSASAYILNQHTSPKSRAILLVGEQPYGGNYGYLAHHSANYASAWGNYDLANATYLAGNDTNGLGIIAGNSQGKIVFGTSTSEKMRLVANGNLGIGTTAPDAKLTVKGNIHAEEVKVDLSVPGPDYVFKEGYDLKSLEEVQNYIKTHGHLPNIPSAQEMEENGIQLGEINMKLLEKIEELTLYALQQQKELYKKEQKLGKVTSELNTVKSNMKQQEKRLQKLEHFLNLQQK